MNKKVLTLLSVLAAGALVLTACATNGGGAPGKSASDISGYGQSEGFTQRDVTSEELAGDSGIPHCAAEGFGHVGGSVTSLRRRSRP